MKKDDQREKTSVSLRPSLVIAAQRRMLDLGKRANISDAVEEALELWIAESGNNSQGTEEVRQNTNVREVTTRDIKADTGEIAVWLDVLRELLESGHGEVADAIKSNLKAFRELLARARRSPGKDYENAINAELREALRQERKIEEYAAGGGADKAVPTTGGGSAPKRRKAGGSDPDRPLSKVG